MSEKISKKPLGIFTDEIIESQLESQAPLPVNFQSTLQFITDINQEEFYQEYKRIYGISFEINQQFKVQNLLKEELMGKVTKLDTNTKKNESETKKRLNVKKRNRRGAEDIERKWKCYMRCCGKEYGSESSLLQHVKLKHPEIDQEEK